jgi:hypothetical protein
MLRCPHCQAKANLIKVLQSSKRKPFQCPACGEYSELPIAQRIVIIALVAVLMFFLFEQKTLEALLGDEEGIPILIAILAPWLYVKFVCRLTALDQATARQRSTLKVSWILGGEATPLKFIIAGSIIPVWYLIRVAFFTHIPVSRTLPVILAYSFIMAVIGWKKFRR